MKYILTIDYAGFKKGNILHQSLLRPEIYGKNKHFYTLENIHIDIIKSLRGVFQPIDEISWLSKAYEKYKSDERVNGQFDFDAFAEVVLGNMPA